MATAAAITATKASQLRHSNDIRLQLSDGRVANPEIVGVDEETDLALLKVDLGPLPANPLGRSDQIRIGDVVLAIGNPYGLTKSVTQGIVSATGRVTESVATFENFIQTEAAINEGNSGGALINTAGQLLGINTAILAQNTSTEGIGFAIPVDLVRGVVEEIKQHGRVIRGYVGFVPEELSRTEATGLGINPNMGIVLTGVTEGSPAESVGLSRGDIILAINGEQIRTRRQALLIVARLNPGDTVDIEGMRNSQRFRTTLTAVERPPQQIR